MSTLQRLTDRGLIKPPRWLPGGVQYETIMGSVAYGVSSDTSDLDVYGWAIPPRDDVFPHLRGEIPGFGTPKPQFQQYQEHHVVDHDALGGQRTHLRPEHLRNRQVLQPGDAEQPQHHRLAVHPGELRPAQYPRGRSRAREPEAVLAQGRLVPVQELCVCSATQAVHQDRPGEAGRPRGRARLRHEVRLSCRPPDPGSRADHGRGRYRHPAEQRAAQGDPPGRWTEDVSPGLVLRQAVGAGEGLRREQAAARTR